MALLILLRIVTWVGWGTINSLIITCADVPKRVNRASGVTIYRKRERDQG